MSSSTERVREAVWVGPLRTRSSSVPPIVRARSNSRSQRPRHEERIARSRETPARLSATSAQKLLTRALLPTPASPATSTSRPDPPHTSERHAFEHSELGLPLEQVRPRRNGHSWIVIARPTQCKWWQSRLMD